MAFDAERPQDRARERGLSRAQLALQQHGIARPQAAGNPRTQLRGRGFIGQRHDRLESRHLPLLARAPEGLNAGRGDCARSFRMLTAHAR